MFTKTSAQKKFFAILLFSVFVQTNLSANVPDQGWEKNGDKILIYRNVPYLSALGGAFFGALGVGMIAIGQSELRTGLQVGVPLTRRIVANLAIGQNFDPGVWVNRIIGGAMAGWGCFMLKVAFEQYGKREEPIMTIDKDGIWFEGSGFTTSLGMYQQGNFLTKGGGFYPWSSIKKIVKSRYSYATQDTAGTETHIQIITNKGSFKVFDGDLKVNLHELVTLIEECMPKEVLNAINNTEQLSMIKDEINLATR